jgi:hypothetical protein
VFGARLDGREMGRLETVIVTEVEDLPPPPPVLQP